MHPVREHIPIYLAAIGPKNLELTGEIADGWLAIFFAPEHAGELARSTIDAGRGQGGQDAWSGFDVVPTVAGRRSATTSRRAPTRPRRYAALYVGGMGSREQNFYNQLACRMGFEAEAARVQDLYLASDYAEAAAAVPLDFIDRTSLLGPVERIADRMQALRRSGVTTLNVPARLRRWTSGSPPCARRPRPSSSPAMA